MENKQDEFFKGIGLGFGLIITGIVLPFLFMNKGIMTGAIILVVLGIMGLGIELDKNYKQNCYTNIFMGFALILLGISILLLFTNVFTKILFLALLLLGLYAFISGSLNWLHIKKSNTISAANRQPQPTDTTRNIPFRVIFSGILAVSGFLANIFSILSFFYN